MNNILKTCLRVASLKAIRGSALQSVTNGNNLLSSSKRQFARSLWHMCTRSDATNGVHLHSPSNVCSCGCGSRRVHTKGEKELHDFLVEEIAAERKAQKMKSVPKEFNGFNVKVEGSEVTLTKEEGGETIEINFNVNHTVDTEAEAEVNPNADKPELGELKSKPSFEVDIKRGSQTLGFSCSFLSEQAGDDDNYNDIFGIDEVTMYEGEWSDKSYAVSGEVLDGYLYDLLMTLLEDKGITNEFVDKLSEFSTGYEHHSYIDMLERLKKFSAGK